MDEFLRAARGGLKIFHPREREAVELSDLIITHSELIRDLCMGVVSVQSRQSVFEIIWRSEWITEEARCHGALARQLLDARHRRIFAASSEAALTELPASRTDRFPLQDLCIHVVGEQAASLSGVSATAW
jgi:hypothetical protein